MDISQLSSSSLNSLSKMNRSEIAETERRVNMINRQMGMNPLKGPEAMSKDSFLKLLVTQLRHQDPTKPMEDREFISQMAQFSSLEQMSNLNKEVRNLLLSSNSERAFGLLGREVDAFDSESGRMTSGEVTSVEINNGNCMIKIGNAGFSIDDIKAVRVKNPEPETAQLIPDVSGGN